MERFKSARPSLDAEASASFKRQLLNDCKRICKEVRAWPLLLRAATHTRALSLLFVGVEVRRQGPRVARPAAPVRFRSFSLPLSLSLFLSFSLSLSLSPTLSFFLSFFLSLPLAMSMIIHSSPAGSGSDAALGFVVEQILMHQLQVCASSRPLIRPCRLPTPRAPRAAAEEGDGVLLPSGQGGHGAPSVEARPAVRVPGRGHAARGARGRRRARARG